MSNTVVLDLFLGDSGKGKIVDYLAQDAVSVVRFNGSNNAGHTLRVDDIEYKTHAVPSGVLYSNITNFIGHGCAIDPRVLLGEMETFQTASIYISGQAHLILPHHIQLDIQREGINGVGSTKCGVAPAYESKAARRGLRYEDLLLQSDDFLRKAAKLYPDPIYMGVLSQLYKDLPQWFRDKIVKDSIAFIHNLINKGPMVFEGAQGCFLDVDVGDYPYVTSSNCTIGAVLTGTGLPIHKIDEIIGVIKAYGSYVGTNIDFDDITDAELNNKLCDLGHEYGATTGRRRRLCWLDLDQIKRAVMINGPTKLAVTRMDTLGQMPKIYLKLDGQLIEFESWGDLSGIKSIKDLPVSAIKYLNTIQSELGVPVWAIGIGPSREDLLIC